MGRRSRFNDNVVEMVRASYPKVGVEVGVWRGELSEALLAAFPELYMLMVDRWIPYDSRLGKISEEAMLAVMADAVARTAPYWDRRMVIVADSVAASRMVPDGSLDFAFLDGDHVEDAIRADLDVWIPKVRLGGVVCGHDYCPGFWDGVVRQVDGHAAALGREAIIRSKKEGLWWFRR